MIKRVTRPAFGLSLCLGVTLAPAGLSAQGFPPVTDGPYVTWSGDTLATVRGVCADSVHVTEVRPKKGVLQFSNPCAPSEQYSVPAAAPKGVDQAIFSKAKRIFAISDVEGEYDNVVALLKTAGVINDKGQWAWGDGHLVLVGDMVDRGSKVTEVLWFIRGLEQQARKAGGYVHYVLGNHDTMLLYGDHRYVASKYKLGAAKMGVPLVNLFDNDSDLGRWMRSKPVMLKIDDVLFVHGGLSPEFAIFNMSIDSVNKIARAGLLDSEDRQDEFGKLVFGSNGPLWYRGYFADTPTDSTALKESLTKYGVKTVVVGHTVVEQIERKIAGQVVAIDVTFPKAENTQGLLIEQGKFYRVDAKGVKKPLD